ncbi:DinB family protein [Deinococcus sonorensis]|uniref:DinB family protein n=2 Tax=Deinococcus sonorensis TaxID=309891 RepID=A0AAU7UCD7_9DEIO
MTLPTLGAFLAEQYRAELEAFRAALDAVPDEQFGVATLSHSPAWHALHIGEWLRVTVLEDRTPTFHHLGWEDREWVRSLGTAPAPLSETASKADILGQLDDIGARAVATLEAATETQLGGMVPSPSAPSGERPRLPALGQHLRHIAYHRGQVQLGKKGSR